MADSLGDRIRRARLLKGMSQAELAAAVGASARAVGDWERDQRAPRNLPRIEAVLGPLRTPSESPRAVKRKPDPQPEPDADQESLQQLVRRRMKRWGIENAHQLFLAGGGAEYWNKETVRKIVNQGHHKIEDDTVERLAHALRVPENEIRAAAGKRLRGEPFELPPEAAELSQAEREILRQVLKAILGQYREDARDRAPQRLRAVELREQEPDFRMPGAARDSKRPPDGPDNSK